MIKKILLISFLCGWFGVLFVQKFTLSGYISDSENGEVLIGANVYNANDYLGTITNTYGFYSLTLPAGKVKLTISFVGYSTFQDLPRFALQQQLQSGYLQLKLHDFLIKFKCLLQHFLTY
ncbi:MAG: carboxypeptidase-like regulatory domain-containing protein [Salinivirgaceae bacterium]